MIHGLVFNGPHRKVRVGPWWSANANIDWEAILVCKLGEALNTTLRRLTGLRASFRVDEWILIHTMRVKKTCWQVEGDPDGPPRFRY